ncbi:T9SS type A sorting domain-containing protein [Pontibacter sp. G13]|uniref:T9SS type A sorting domain-containing protein n=1 Tax=Pontibacter sp. G13 TaxID=3074898 RepID=UPI002889F650|nr:T9SS type A sorting domain-containing protein [Pontibacter sp. G13]WNJ17043.1 T9SS type A sorting domain-containing protein [Pontibacter sp. G13]
MLPRNKSYVWLLFALSFWGNVLIGQNLSSQQANYIAELETAQSPVTGTFASCSMKRLGHLLTEGDQILIHRSTDQTASWSLIEVIHHPDSGRLIDPVMTVDVAGVFYVIFMRIQKAGILMPDRRTHLDLYRSIDDGVSWQFVDSAYTDMFPDYPQLISRGNGGVYMIFGNFTLPSNQRTIFMHTGDSGSTWSTPYEFDYPSEQLPEMGIADINWGPDSSLHIGFASGFWKGPCHISSDDFGATWSEVTLTRQQNNPALYAAVSKVISNPAVDFFGIIAHRPHFSSTPITYHYEDGDSLGTTYIGTGAYAEGILMDDSIIHVIYNSVEDDTFRINYLVSGDQGRSFSAPIVLYSALNDFEEYGEYQSLIHGQDGQFYLTFCDWGDSSKAKSLVFEPLEVTYNPTTSIGPKSEAGYALFPNPVSTILTLEFPDDAQVSAVSLHTLEGKRVQMVGPALGQPQVEIDVSPLPDGMYIVRFKEQARYVIRRFVKVSG